VVCSTAPDGLVGRSNSTGTVTWRVPSSGSGKKNGGLALATVDHRAVTSGGRVLRAANLVTGKDAWSHRLPSGHAYSGVGQANRIVFALEATTGLLAQDGRTSIVLAAYRTSDGAPLWHRSVNADPAEPPYSFGGRVYTTTEGGRVTARDARTGNVVGASPSRTQCPHLVSGHGYLVCTGSPRSASDTFPPVKRPTR
jgi:outer membrane protein assembly factor BamB